MNSTTLWGRFKTPDGRTGFGTLQGSLIAEYTGAMFDMPRPSGNHIDAAQVTWIAPCVPSKMIALWNNFRALSAKLGKQAPAHPLYLIKPGTSIIGPGDPIRRPAHYSGKIAYEGELGIVIGRECKDATVSEARECIFGYTCVNDVTAADILNETPDFAQWTRAKGFDTFGAIGPFIASDLDWPNARVITRLAGNERQNYLLSDMIIPPADLVTLLSRDMTLLPGDVIACGTSLGVGSIRDEAEVEVSIQDIGSLRNILTPCAMSNASVA